MLLLPSLSVGFLSRIRLDRVFVILNRFDFWIAGCFQRFVLEYGMHPRRHVLVVNGGSEGRMIDHSSSLL